MFPPTTKDEAVSDSYDWISGSFASDPLGGDLKSFEDTLRCQICADWLKVPVITPCSHTFCSECIRSSLRATTMLRRVSQCPSCKEAVDERQLLYNKALEDTVKSFRGFRDSLMDRVVRRQNGPSIGDDRLSHLNGRDGGAPKSKKRCSPSSANAAGGAAVKSELPHKAPPLMQNLPVASLRKLMRKEGLSENGSKSEMMARMRMFIDIYKSQRDLNGVLGANQMTVEMIRLEVRKREKQMREEAMKDKHDGKGSDSRHLQKLHSSALKPSDSEEAESKSKSYEKFDKKFNAGFKDMIQQLREKESKRKKEKGRGKGGDGDGGEGDRNCAEGGVRESSSPGASSVVTSEACRAGEEEEEPPLGFTNSNRDEDQEGAGSAETAPVTPGVKRPKKTFALQPLNGGLASESPLPPPAILAKPVEPTNVITIEESMDESPSTRFKPSIIGPWECTYCTFINTVNTNPNANCSMCGNKRKIPKVK